MEYTNEKVEVTRGRVREQEKRIARQRKRIEDAIADRHPADELQARLLIMEQSLIAMARFLRILERDIADDLGIQKHQTQKHIKSAELAPARAPAETLDAMRRDALRPVSAAPAAVHEQAVPFDTVVKAMRKLTER